MTSGQDPRSNPDAGVSDAQLEQQVRLDLITETQAAPTESAWALAFGPPKPDLGGGGTGGGYALDPTQLQAAIDIWQGILDHARTYDRAIAMLSNAITAAGDEASVGFTRQLEAAGKRLLTSHRSLTAYAENYLARLRATLRSYQ
ncbi:MAG TPA: hypothetical protein VGD84_15735, partial [Pseudonocardiaceae bacterium]